MQFRSHSTAVVFGLAAGFSLALCIVGVGALLYFGGKHVRAKRAADHAQVADLAKLIAAPLVAVDQQERTPSEAELRAGIGRAIDLADSFADDNGELAPIAAEYAESLRAAQRMVDNPPSVQPLVREGIDTWRGSLNDDNTAFMIGLLGMGAEFSKLSEASDAVKAIHARVVACRLRLAEVAARTAPPQKEGTTAQWKFEESGAFTSFSDDRFVLTNVSGQALTGVLLLTELTGSRSDSFSNCFFVDRWEPDQVLLAVCASESGGRETVHGVQRARCRIISNERSTQVAEWSR